MEVPRVSLIDTVKCSCNTNSNTEPNKHFKTLDDYTNDTLSIVYFSNNQEEIHVPTGETGKTHYLSTKYHK